MWECSVNPTGGTAYLSLENTDEPFLHGIKFTAMPPTKRFRDMEQLSGGEKARPLILWRLPSICNVHNECISLRMVVLMSQEPLSLTSPCF